MDGEQQTFLRIQFASIKIVMGQKLLGLQNEANGF